MVAAKTAHKAAPKDKPKKDAAPEDVAPETSVGADVSDVPDNTPTPLAAVPDETPKKAKYAAPAGYAYVIHPKNAALRCLVDEKSVPELLLDGYKLG